MLIIIANLEDKSYHYKEWYKKMESIIGEHFDTTKDFDNSISITQKIIFESEKLELPDGLSIPDGSKITLDILSGNALVIINKVTRGTQTTIEAGIRSSEFAD